MTYYIHAYRRQRYNIVTRMFFHHEAQFCVRNLKISVKFSISLFDVCSFKSRKLFSETCHYVVVDVVYV